MTTISCTVLDDYLIRPAVQSDIPIINGFLERNFHPEETLLNCLLSRSKLTSDQLHRINEDQRHIIADMVQNYSCQVMVHKDSTEIIGVNVMITSENPNCKEIDRSPEVRPPEIELLCHYFDYMNEMIDRAELFGKFPDAKRALELYAVAIDKEHRRKGLSTELIKKALNYAKDNDVDLVFGLFTSPYSKKAARKSGLKEILDLNLEDFKGKNGDFPFSSCSGEHGIATVMAALIK